MNRTRLHDKTRLEEFLRRNTFLHIYGLGDLDDAFWPFTAWYGWVEEENIRALVLLYTGLSRPALLALGDDEELPHLARLLRSLAPVLPRAFYAHLTPSLAPVLQETFLLTLHGEYRKMALTNPSRLDSVNAGDVAQLSPADAEEAQAFFNESYPGHWFEPSMLATGQYVGIRKGGRLACVAGVHVYSPRYKIAVLGNIATHPDHRHQGFAAVATAALCKNLLKTVTHIGLNVKADNFAASACYRRLGFEFVSAYEEYSAGPIPPETGISTLSAK